MNQKKVITAGVMLALSQAAMAVDFEAYGSLRLGLEYVDPDNNVNDSYTGFRDAYSRVGAKASHAINDDWSVLAQLELPLDIANFDIHSPYDQEDKVRIAKVQVSGPIGTVWAGRDWLPYYNAIAYPVDYFSSYYSGWATATTFRREESVGYYSPNFKGFSFAAVTTNDNDPESDNRNQFTLSYAKDGLTLAAGLDDNAGNTDNRNWGFAASYTTGPWYLAAKYEKMELVGANNDGDVWNGLVQYAIDDKNTVRGMIAEVDFPGWGWFPGETYGGTVIHLGFDHQYNDDLKFFAEYYREDSASAIGPGHDDFLAGGYIAPARGGGQVVTVGARYDFSTN